MKKEKTVRRPDKEKPQVQLTDKRLRYYPLLLGLTALTAAFLFIVVSEHDFLYFVQELNLFLYTPLFLKQQLVVAGGLLTYLGTYFTQFFYHPWLGTLWLCLWCGVLLWLTQRTFALPARWGALLLVPLALVLLTDFELGYWVYVLKLRGYFFIAVIGCSLALAAVWVFRVLPRHHALSSLFMLLSAYVLYPVAGFYGLLAVVLMVVIDWRRPDGTLTGRVVNTLLGLLLVVFVPLVYYRQVYYQAHSDTIWQQALPLFDVGEKFPQFYMPFCLLFAFFILLAACHREQWSLRLLKRPALWVSLQVVIIVGTTFFCSRFWYHDDTFRKELKMQLAVERQDWQGVLDVAAANTDDPTRLLWMYKNLAIFKLGRAGNEMYNYRNGSKQPAFPVSVPMVVQCGKQLYLNFGLPNYCYRWCMEDGVEYGWRTLYLKYLVRSSLLNGEPVLAQKYIDLLKQTHYHRDWATHYEHFIAHPEDLAKDPELGPVMPLMSHEDLLASDQSVVETFLLTLLSMQQTNNPVKADLAVMAALQQKEIPLFWQAFFQYANLHPTSPMPRHYQEAAYLFGHLENKVDISTMPFDDAVKRSYEQFMAMAQQYAGMNEQQLANIMRPYFGNTYYYDYFLMRGLKTY